MSKTTLDLSTLPDISDGAHTVKVKAKAGGYKDSEFSNEVSYTKATNLVNFTLYKEDGDTGSDVPTYIKLDGVPTNADDYDYYIKGDGSSFASDTLYNKTGAAILKPVTLSARYVYVWGWCVYVNNTTEYLYGGNKTFDQALKITLSQNDNIKVQCQYSYD